jgi:hypothetical protein
MTNQTFVQTIDAPWLDLSQFPGTAILPIEKADSWEFTI